MSCVYNSGIRESFRQICAHIIAADVNNSRLILPSHLIPHSPHRSFILLIPEGDKSKCINSRALPVPAMLWNREGERDAVHSNALKPSLIWCTASIIGKGTGRE